MKILLIGEYSRFHNSLKKGLVALGHEVTLVGDGDLYKSYPVDISTKPKWFSENFILRKFKNLVFRFLKVDLLLLEQGLRYYILRRRLRGFDVVQLINSDALKTYPWLARPTLTSIFQHNKSIVLSACGDDVPFVNWMLTTDAGYHLLTPYRNGTLSAKQVSYSLKYTKPCYKKQFQLVEAHVSQIIPTDMDYYVSLKNHEKVNTLIPTPVDVSEFEEELFPPMNTIHIFHGISRMNCHKKGNAYFEDALVKIKKTYGDLIKITTAESLPYADYIKSYNSAHILLDQVYSYDQGYNALEAMAMGKVVFTGAETCFYEHYNLKEAVCINAKPDVAYLVSELSRLIENPSELVKISANARAFVQTHHNLETVAKQYEKAYSS